MSNACIYQQFVRAFASDAARGPTGVAVVTRCGEQQHERAWVEHGPVYDAVLAGILGALRSLNRPESVVEIHTNNQAAAGVCSGEQTAHAAESTVASIRALLGERPRTVVGRFTDTAAHPMMARAWVLAEEALRGAA